MKAGKEQLKSDMTTGLHKIEEKIIGCNTNRNKYECIYKKKWSRK